MSEYSVSSQTEGMQDGMILIQYNNVKGEYDTCLNNLIDDLIGTKDLPDLFSVVEQEAAKARIPLNYVFQTAFFIGIPQWTRHLIKYAPKWIKKERGSELVNLLCEDPQFIQKIKELIQLLKFGVVIPELKELEDMFINEERIKEIIKQIHGNPN